MNVNKNLTVVPPSFTGQQETVSAVQHHHLTWRPEARLLVKSTHAPPSPSASSFHRSASTVDCHLTSPSRGRQFQILQDRDEATVSASWKKLKD